MMRHRTVEDLSEEIAFLTGDKLFRAAKDAEALGRRFFMLGIYQDAWHVYGPPKRSLLNVHGLGLYGQFGDRADASAFVEMKESGS